LHTKTINLKDIGSVQIKKSARAKYLNIAIKPGTGVVVTIPNYVSYDEGERFVHSKTDWIKEHLEKLKNSGHGLIVFDENTEFKTHKHTLKIVKHAEQKIKFTVANGLLTIYYPDDIDIKSQRMQKSIKYIIDFTLREEAIRYLPKRLDELSKAVNIPYNRLFIKNIKSRWGSCSGRNNINLNIHLMRLPEHLIDYVILHELAHVVEKNHGRQFWHVLDKITGNAKLFDKELKNYRINY